MIPSHPSRLLACMFIVIGAAAVAQPQPPGRPPNLSPPKVQPPPLPPAPNVDSFFAALRGRIIDGANQIDTWRRESGAALGKRATDFAGCPSNDAQKLYDELRARRAAAQRTRDAAAAAEAEAAAARDRCISAGVPAASCNTSLNGLTFTATRQGAAAADNELARAMGALKELRCVAGCDRKLDLAVPGAQVGQGEPIVPTATACTGWDRGSFFARAGYANGEVGAELRARLPRCTQTRTFEAQVCRQWDLNVAWPHLTKARIVPPELTPNRVTLEVPTASVRVVGGFATQCQSQEQICTRLQGNATISLDTANPLATLRSVGQAQCAQTTTIGCSQPPLGIEPTWTNLSVPDLARARLRVTEAPGPGAKTPVGMVRGGSIEVDFSAPALRAACKQWEPLALPNPRLQVSVRTVHTEICAQPRTGPLVANP